MIQTEFVSLSICTISLTTGLTQVVSCCVLEIPKVLVQPMRGNQCDQIDGNFTTLVNFKGFYSGSKIFKGFSAIGQIFVVVNCPFSCTYFSSFATALDNFRF